MITKTKLKEQKEFLKLQSEETISRLEEMLEKEKNASTDTAPMTQEELNKRIDQSESDFQNNRFKNSSALLAKYE